MFNLVTNISCSFKIILEDFFQTRNGFTYWESGKWTQIKCKTIGTLEWIFPLKDATGPV